MVKVCVYNDHVIDSKPNRLLEIQLICFSNDNNLFVISLRKVLNEDAAFPVGRSRRLIFRNEKSGHVVTVLFTLKLADLETPVLENPVVITPACPSGSSKFKLSVMHRLAPMGRERRITKRSK